MHSLKFKLRQAAKSISLIKESSTLLGRPIHQHVAIIDLQGLGKFDHLNLKCRKSITHVPTLGGSSGTINVRVDDVCGLGMQHAWQPGINLFSKISQQLDENFPGKSILFRDRQELQLVLCFGILSLIFTWFIEVIHKIYVVRAPKIFPILYKLVRPFLAAKTSEKVMVLGSDYQSVWQC